MPHTKLGLWSVRLETAFVAMFLLNIVLVVGVFDKNPAIWPLFVTYVMIMLLCGLFGGVLGTLAVIRQREHAAFVWLAILVGLFVLLVMINELWQAFAYLRNV